MNVKTRHKIWFAAKVAQNVQLGKLKILTNLSVCVLIFVGGFQSGDWSIAIGGMTFVQSINFGELVTAYREAKGRQQPPIQDPEDDPPRRER